jgi:Domain of unknown function (DUF4169)
MGDVVNLRGVRKARARDNEAKVADANRLKFGRTKGERELTEARAQLSERALDAHKRDDT